MTSQPPKNLDPRLSDGHRNLGFDDWPLGDSPVRTIPNGVGRRLHRSSLGGCVSVTGPGLAARIRETFSLYGGKIRPAFDSRKTRSQLVLPWRVEESRERSDGRKKRESRSSAASVDSGHQISIPIEAIEWNHDGQKIATARLASSRRRPSKRRDRPRQEGLKCRVGLAPVPSVLSAPLEFVSAASSGMNGALLRSHRGPESAHASAVPGSPTSPHLAGCMP